MNAENVAIVEDPPGPLEGSTSCGLVPSSVTEASATLGPRSTLVVCPVSVLSNWQVKHSKHGKIMVHCLVVVSG